MSARWIKPLLATICVGAAILAAAHAQTACDGPQCTGGNTAPPPPDTHPPMDDCDDSESCLPTPPPFQDPGAQAAPGALTFEGLPDGVIIQPPSDDEAERHSGSGPITGSGNGDLWRGGGGR